MKKLFYLYFAGCLFVLVSCKKQLDTAPTDSVSEGLIFQNVGNLSTVLEGTWASMMDDFYGGTYSNPGFKTIGLVSDAMGDDVAVIPTKYGYRDAYPFTELNDKTKSRVNGIWSQLYKIINNANIVIAHADKVDGDANAKQALKGQALALRANSYLTLASFYQFSYLKDSTAKAVPVYTEPANSTTQGQPRATLKQVYELIFSDLIQAEQLLSGYQRTAKYKINLDVVEGLLARAYLNTGRWGLAAAKAVAARKNYPLMSGSDYTKGFNDVNNSEWIWGHPEIPSQSNGSYSFHFLDVSSAGSYYYSFMADPHFMELFDDGDYRKALFSWNGVPGREGYLQYKKFLFRNDLTADLVLMRSAEEYLVEAEANARLNNLQAGATALNVLKAARNAKPFDITGKTQQDLIDAVLIERRKELWGEGFGLADIIRNQLAVVRKPYVDANGNDIKVTVTTPDGTTKQVAAKYHTALRFPDKTNFVPNSPYYIFAIPQSEEQNNPNLYK